MPITLLNVLLLKNFPPKEENTIILRLLIIPTLKLKSHISITKQF